MSATALVVVVPQADALLSTHRQHHGTPTTDGVPAHVTVLYPFRRVISGRDAAMIGAVASEIDAFEVTFARSGNFEGEVVYLVPEPSRPFHYLSVALAAAFPDCPPYGGAFAHVVPHLTVADGLDEATARSLEADLEPALPIVAPVTRLTMLHHDDEHTWLTLHTWPLGPR